MIKLYTDEIRQAANELRAGDKVLLSGTVLTARDAAHKEIKRIFDRGGELPFSLEGAVIYYAGPTATPKGKVCGAFGPTTSCRMDLFTPMMLENGVAATIGKGNRSDSVIRAVKAQKSPYFAAIGGAGALAARHIKSLEEIAFLSLGCESVKRLLFEDFPLYVAIDIFGGNIYG